MKCVHQWYRKNRYHFCDSHIILWEDKRIFTSSRSFAVLPSYPTLILFLSLPFFSIIVCLKKLKNYFNCVSNCEKLQRVKYTIKMLPKGGLVEPVVFYWLYICFWINPGDRKLNFLCCHFSLSALWWLLELALLLRSNCYPKMANATYDWSLNNDGVPSTSCPLWCLDYPLDFLFSFTLLSLKNIVVLPLKRK